MYKEPFTAALIKAADVENLIKDPSCVDVEAFEGPFREAAKGADEAGKLDDALAYRLFGALVSFHFRPEDRTEPFSNMVGFADGSRSLVGSDLDQSDVEALFEIVGDLNVLALKTRVADLVWSRDKSKADCARIAVEGYAAMVEGLVAGSVSQRFENPSPTSVAAQNFLTRGFAIARRTGWQKSESERLKKAGIDVLRNASEEGGIALVRFGRLLFEQRVPGAEDILSQLPCKVEKSLSAGDFHAAEELQKLIISQSRSEANDNPDKELFLKLAAIHEAQADFSDSAFLKTHSLQLSIDSLHGVKGVRDARQKLHEKLREAQLHLSDEFTPISHSINLSDEIERMLSGYDSLDLIESLKRLALTELPKDPKQLVANAIEEMEKYPLSSLFSTSILDGKGRTQAKTSGGGRDNEDTVRHKVIQHQEISMGVAVNAAIRPARQLITERFAVDQTLLYEICRMSPFVASGHEHLVSRGLQAFLYGDDQVAAVCLGSGLIDHNQ